MLFSKQKVIRRTIPGNNQDGLMDSINMHRDLTIKAVELDLNIENASNENLKVELHGPNGKSVGSLSVSGGKAKQSFSGKDFDVFNGMKSKGDWNIKVIDSAGNGGKLIDWTLKFNLANSKKSEFIISDQNTLSSCQYCHTGGNVLGLSADVNAEHGQTGNLVLDLTSPGGKTVTLQSKKAGSNNQIKTTYTNELKDLIGESSKGKWTLKVNDSETKDPGRLISWKLNIKTGQPAATVAPSKPDDLTKIEGVGPKIAQILNEGGIKTFAKLASSSSGDVKKLLDAAGPRFKMHDPGSWPRQSRLAADGKWDELEKLQDELDGGR